MKVKLTTYAYWYINLNVPLLLELKDFFDFSKIDENTMNYFKSAVQD
jgi:hypothetical protein